MGLRQLVLCQLCSASKPRLKLAFKGLILKPQPCPGPQASLGPAWASAMAFTIKFLPNHSTMKNLLKNEIMVKEGLEDLQHLNNIPLQPVVWLAHGNSSRGQCTITRKGGGHNSKVMRSPCGVTM